MNPHTKQSHASHSGAKGTGACYGVGVKKILLGSEAVLKVVPEKYLEYD